MAFCLREFMVPKTEGRMSDRPPLAVRRTDMKHPQLQRSSRVYRWNMQESFISRLWNRENTRMEIQRRLLFPGAFAHEALPRADDDEPDKKRTPKIPFRIFGVRFIWAGGCPARYRAGCSGRLLKMALIRSMSNLAERS